MKSYFQRFLNLWARWERHFAIGSLIVGFSFDLIIAKRPDNIYDNALLLFYLCTSALCIVLLNRRASQKISEPNVEPLLLLLILQFCFGGLSSNLLVLYGKSGTPAGDLLFVGILFSMLIGNEFLRTRYEQTRFHIGVYYLLLLTYCVIAVPTFILHSIGPREFLISGAISIGVIVIFLCVLSLVTRLFRGAVGRQRFIESSSIVVGIFLFFNLLYFTNVIPPVPLSLKDIGIYHFVMRNSDGSYEGQYEAAPWWQFWQSTNSVFSAAPGDNAYCLSSVFAPTGLSTPIEHRWEKYNTTTRMWQTHLVIPFPISGGSAQGYRGFSEVFSISPGLWRCDVETSEGQIIGQAQFTVNATSSEPQLQTVSL